MLLPLALSVGVIYSCTKDHHLGPWAVLPLPGSSPCLVEPRPGQDRPEGRVQGNMAAGHGSLAHSSHCMARWQDGGTQLPATWATGPRPVFVCL